MVRVVKIIVHIVNLMKKMFLKLFFLEKNVNSFLFFLIGKNINDYITAEFSENGYLIWTSCLILKAE